MTLDFPLPSADTSILRWSDHDMSVWDKLSFDAQVMSRRIDNPGLSAETSQRARTVLASEHPELHPDLADRKICRAIVTLWAGDRRLAEETMRVPVLQMVCDNGNFTRLFTFALANVYFTHFVHLDEWDEGLFALTSDRLREAVAQQTASHGRDVLFAVRERPELAIGADAPELIARQAFEQDRDLPSVMRETGLGDYSQGNYAETARQRLYLDRIAKADPRNSYDWLADLCDSDIADAPAGDGRRFGHLVLEAMTQHPVDNPSREWESTILKIGDDPRARGTIKWNKWWSRIPSENLRRVIAWLSGEDIRLFLEAVEVYGRKNNKADLLRMFPDRERFLKGLLELKMVRETRLFAGPSARSAIRLIMGTDLRTSITPIVGGNYRDTAVIFMNCGDFHIVEGSHNFKMRVLRGDPPEIMSDWKMARIDYSDFLSGVEHARMPGEDFVALTHNVHKKWISDALLFIEQAGQYIPPEDVMTAETYQDVSATRPLPVRPKNWRRPTRGAE
jgi:hypothetical protein